MKPGRRRIDVNLDELDRVLDGARQAPLSEADCDEHLHTGVVVVYHLALSAAVLQLRDHRRGRLVVLFRSHSFRLLRRKHLSARAASQPNRYDAEARKGGLTAEERLRFHQEHSGPVMKKLHGWLEAQFAERKTEPNSGLGKAITYLLRHWKALTTFLREAGAPLDNNLCERALKRAVLHRKNALFYRTMNGAQVGDLFMTLIHTCQLCGANSFDYLTELQRHVQKLAAEPAAWMPWNYREALQRVGV
jgi:transposase